MFLNTSSHPPSLTHHRSQMSNHGLDPHFSPPAPSMSASKPSIPISRSAGTPYERPERARTSHACEPCRYALKYSWCLLYFADLGAVSARPNAMASDLLVAAVCIPAQAVTMVMVKAGGNESTTHLHSLLGTSPVLTVSQDRRRSDCHFETPCPV